MNKNIKDIIDLAAVYGWSVDLVRDNQVNFRNDDNDLVIVWLTAKKGYTITHKIDGRSPVSKKGVDVVFLEDVFRDNDMFSKKPVKVITIGIVDNFLRDHKDMKCSEVIGKFKEWLP